MIEYSSKPHIYKLTDTRNGMTYVGQHNGSKKKYFTGGKIPKRIIKKHGKEVFKREIIVQGNFNQELLNQLEIHYIRLYRSCINWGDFGYNLTEGGDGAMGIILSKEAREKISKANKGRFSGSKNPMYGRKWSEEQRLSQSKKIIEAIKSGRYKKKNILGKNNPFYGKKHTEETKRKLSEAKKGNTNWSGRVHKDESKEKMSIAHKGKILSNEHKNNIKKSNKSAEINGVKVCQINKDTYEIIEIHKTISSAARKLNIHSENITSCCSGKLKTSGGYIWKRKSDLTVEELNSGYIN